MVWLLFNMTCIFPSFSDSLWIEDEWGCRAWFKTNKLKCWSFLLEVTVQSDNINDLEMKVSFGKYIIDKLQGFVVGNQLDCHRFCRKKVKCMLCLSE